ncbi:hypothetical protein KYLE_104 [Pantoea phage Kyle]|uniref:Uncharacterized protein n=1 Tax=Pantoea phage Kyle TaxID=2589665 RepID=A0A514A8Q7_9CAUD|nr:endonuclease VII [Pantoea phage Kyle]QDH49652.1 hypothetical protein KYLE_104 [Pantoea phage Kyle]
MGSRQVTQPGDDGAKECARCNRVQPLTSFTKDSRRLDGRRSYCKACERASKKAYTEKNADAIKQRNHEHHLKRWPKKGKVINHHKSIKRSLRKYAGVLRPDEIAERMDLAPLTVIGYASKFSISLELTKIHWPPEDEATLIKLKRERCKDKDIAAHLGRTIAAVRWRLVALRKEGKL